ncbi:hypothetical protein BCR35DRAFT_328630 [Leucosporidium creatinivorum]|uniref:NmrA-like domain-containing protein n=1 Tax=Leucosporidium creatinivorum TaxID=106004 RepID=A0A1Y2G1V5_9BASI|nr:hypothetical protein BCR35DRAFT_328630 [Leucosporidium creatinivorum]
MSNVQQLLPFEPSTATIAVVGATGNQGLSVIKSLAPLGYHIRALTRSPTSPSTLSLFSNHPNVTPTSFDYSDLSSVEAAFEGADVVYGLTLADTPHMLGLKEESGMISELEQGRRLVDVAKRMGVKMFFWSGAHDAGPPKYRSLATFAEKELVDDYLGQSGIPHVVFRLGSFCENAVTFRLLSPTPEKEGELTLAWPHANLHEAVYPMLWVEQDVGRLVALALEQPAKFTRYGKPISLAGGYYSAMDLAALVSEATGKKVNVNGAPKFAGSDYDVMYETFGDAATPYFEGSTFEESTAFLKAG